MAQSLIACPVCSSASFSNTSALCLALVNVASKWLRCTMCEEELRGLDKLTIHLLGHLIHSPNFKRCLANNDAFLTRSVSNTQPLNLVKNQNEQTKQNSAHGLMANETLSSAFQTGVGNERPSLKIDDEVMIFFNCDNANELETSNDTKVVRAIDSETPSFSGLPKFTVNFEKTSTGSDKSVNVFNYEKESNMSSENYLERSSRDESFQYFFPVTTEDLNSVDKSISDSVRRKDSQLGLCDEKEKEIHNSLLNIELTEVVGNEINCSVEHTKNKINCKNLFLSPKGERVEGFRCDVCSLVFPDENILCMHRKLIHIELHSGMNEPTSYKCHLCSKSFVMKGSLMVHMRVAHFGGAVVARLVEAKQLETDAVSPDSAQFICAVCNKGFQKEQQLAQHEKLHDGKQCDICFKTFTTKYFLRKHKRLHTGEMPYQCSQCNKSFTFQQSYHKHLLYHSDDKPYTCNDCGRSFKELSTLHNHQRIHTGEKPFSCETCGKCFRQRVSYLVHRRIHTGVMPYRCQDCGKTFRYKVSERTHKCCTSTINGGSDVSNSPLSEGKREGLNTFAKENSEEGNDNEREEKISNGVSKHVPARPPMEAESESYPEAASIAPPMEAESQSYPEVASIVPPMEAESESYPEPADFFSLVMSPSDRLQNLSLASDTVEAMSPINHGSINSEDLKQLLYDVADYS